MVAFAFTMIEIPGSNPIRTLSQLMRCLFRASPGLLLQASITGKTLRPSDMGRKAGGPVE